MKLAALLDSWQKWLTFIVALASAYYAAGNFISGRFATSNQAIQAAESRMDLFRTQPGYVLTYLENAYPGYAYCAALSAVQACMSAIGTATDVSPSCHQSANTFTGEQDGTAADGTDRVTTSPMAGELIAQEIDAIARKVGLSEAVLAEKARKMSEQPEGGGAGAGSGCSGDLLDDGLAVWEAGPPPARPHIPAPTTSTSVTPSRRGTQDLAGSSRQARSSARRSSSAARLMRSPSPPRHGGSARCPGRRRNPRRGSRPRAPATRRPRGCGRPRPRNAAS